MNRADTFRASVLSLAAYFLLSSLIATTTSTTGKDLSRLPLTDFDSFNTQTHIQHLSAGGGEWERNRREWTESKRRRKEGWIYFNKRKCFSLFFDRSKSTSLVVFSSSKRPQTHKYHNRTQHNNTRSVYTHISPFATRHPLLSFSLSLPDFSLSFFRSKRDMLLVWSSYVCPSIPFQRDRRWSRKRRAEKENCGISIRKMCVKRRSKHKSRETSHTQPERQQCVMQSSLYIREPNARRRKNREPKVQAGHQRHDRRSTVTRVCVTVTWNGKTLK